MKIRTVNETDAPEWVRMRTALWPDSPGDHAPEIDQFFAVPRGDLATFVAETDAGQLCGFLEAGTRPYAEGCLSSPVGYIEGWWVDPDYRKRGIGAGLIAAAENWARSRGLAEMASDADVDNMVSQRAHRALGYQQEQRIICYRKSL